MIIFHFSAICALLETPFYTLIDVLKNLKSRGPEIVTLLAGRNKNLRWANR